MIAGTASAAWAASGAAWLTGHTDGPPLDAPAGVWELVQRALRRFVTGAAAWGDPGPEVSGLDGMALLGERAALAGLHRQGRRSCGGATRIYRTVDGWLALALPRIDDLELVPAWLGTSLAGWPVDPPGVDVDDAAVERLAAEIARHTTGELVERAALVGLAAGGLGEVRRTEPVHVVTHRPGPRSPGRPLVVDLSSLWAGPLCSDLLARVGADVVKVESVGRPDGMRRDASGLFDLLTAGKRCVALELDDPAGRADLLRLLHAADVVIESSRPRALEQMGIHAGELLAASESKVWLSITAHGRTGRSAMRIGFGDDAAAAGGLVAWDEQREPCFLGDAIADPLTGLVSAAAIAGALAEGGSWLLDVALARVSATAADGITSPARVLDDHEVARPRARPFRGVAPALGVHTDEVLAGYRRRR